jgi:hypothetical protein
LPTDDDPTCGKSYFFAYLGVDVFHPACLMAGRMYLVQISRSVSCFLSMLEY